MLLEELATTSALVTRQPGRSAKVAALADCLGRLGPEEAPVAVAYLAGDLPGGALGVGWATLAGLPPLTAERATLSVMETETVLRQVRQDGGPGSQARRRSLLAGLFERLTVTERGFVLGVLSGELRQGAQGGVMVEAIARACGAPVSAVRRGLLLAGDLPTVAAAALTEGAAGLEQFQLAVMRPLRPMLAQSAPNPAAAMGRICPAAVEWKLDGIRVQVHKLGPQVGVFTRSLADVTERMPQVAGLIRALPAASLVLDGELIGISDDGRPRAFQDTMGQFGTREAAPGAPAGGLLPFFFDCLHVDGQDLIDQTAQARHAALAESLPAGLLVPRRVAENAEQAAQVMEEALAAGQEGILVKSLDAPYEAGRRGAGWIKVKPARTLDLVVLGAEWGHGRRRGWLSNLHLGARQGDGFVMLGKTFKGLTDQLLAWQTERLLSLEVRRDASTVWVRPELVVEVAFDGVQESSRYPGGVTLRFARVKGYRPDKPAGEADTIETVRSIHHGW